MVYSENQVTQIYVVNVVDKKTGNAVPAIAEADAVGTISYNPTNWKKQGIRFLYKGIASLHSTDSIEVSKVTEGNICAAEEMRTPVKTLKLTIDKNTLEGGQDYVVWIKLYGVASIADDDSYMILGSFHCPVTITDANRATTLKKAYATIAKELAGDRLGMYVDVFLDDDLINPIKGTEKLATLAERTMTGIVLKEHEQPWRLGLRSQEPVRFEVCFAPTTLDSVECNDWLTIDDTSTTRASLKTVTDVTSHAIKTKDNGLVGFTNGRNTADMEYFLMGERGDMYRGVNYPYNITTEYLVNPEKEYSYLRVHYYYNEQQVNINRSEKDILFVSDDKSLLNTIATDIRTAIGDTDKSVITETGTIVEKKS